MAAGVGKRMDIRAFYSLKIIKKSFFLLLNGSIMTDYPQLSSHLLEALFAYRNDGEYTIDNLVAERTIRI